jgi:hypothetical protein
MHLVQILLPLRDNAGRSYDEQLFKSINVALVAKFGGLTAFTRSPAKGTWVNAEQEQRDDVFVVEVMAENLDKGWWQSFRERLETQMDQAEIVVRTHAIDRL